MSLGRVGTKRQRGAMQLAPDSGADYTESGFSTNAPPVFQTSSVGSDVTFSHAEYVMDINSSTGFAANTFLLNPGNPILFPWMSRIAALYEEYEFLGLIFEYRKTSAFAVGTTSSAMGVVVIATDYDVEDANYTTKRAMEAAEYACSGAPYDTFIHPVECDRRRNVLGKEYVVPGATTVAQLPGDPRLSAYGMTTVAAIGQQASGTAIGELWVSYHIRLSRPILEDVSTTSFTQHIQGSSTVGGVATINSNSTVGSGFTTTTIGSGTTSILQLSVPASSPLIGGTFLINLRAVSNANASGAWVVPSQSGSSGGSMPFVATSTAGLRDGDLASDHTTSSNTTYGKNVMLSTDVAGVSSATTVISLPIPNSGAFTSFFDVYICPYNSTVNLSAQQRARVRPVEAVSQIAGKDEMDELRAELRNLRTTMKDRGFVSCVMDSGCLGSCNTADEHANYIAQAEEDQELAVELEAETWGVDEGTKPSSTASATPAPAKRDPPPPAKPVKKA
jgi:hypothetical protein